MGKTKQAKQKINTLSQKQKDQENFSEKICHFIGDHLQAPQFLKDNKYIKQGYRINFKSTREILKSFFMIHNESINIWTHFLGVITLIFLTFFLLTQYNHSIDLQQWKQRMIQNVNNQLEPIYKQMKEMDEAFNEQMNERFFEKYKDELIGKIENLRYELIQQIDSHQFDWIDFYMDDYINKNEFLIEKSNTHVVSRWPIFVFLLSAILCLLFSTLFHLFYCKNPKYFQFFLRLDFAGVSLLVSGSTFPPFYYGFYCNFYLAYFYLSLVTIVSAFVFLVSIQEFINKPEYFAFRSFIQGLLGFFSSIPIGHLIYLEVFKENNNDTYSTANSIGYYLVVCFCYLIGLIIFALRCPERYKPGHFDICGASHQLWHVMVLIGIGLTYVASIINFYTRKINICKDGF
ncbi:hypothetical protein IMG5_147130 [Ichthyophthirius multifiliis]|uniref:Uncharacterized protein n=1 Tax=Ichthyophthirius multifiliis TaxID=5932 RepID=G0QY44_ICHMU|nr:hypothetical protein IMG5_147130 [Ichthyophthirius multifiliis]EGR29870.1 hypothetical protein IMG5_147130 [Ichthyophthirius multifiliis]|eukprot:XP_004031106.1 hypothetical protein IMG5_147130 [Ichthyophthirius multifiliis]